VTSHHRAPLSRLLAPSQVGYTLYTGFAHLGAGLCCGMSGLAAGVAIGVAGDAGVRAVAKQSKMYVGMVLILIFAEVRALPPGGSQQHRAPFCAQGGGRPLR
jgi:F0F1-type ATP synthase membrane subunit c/vacuolar-type H+-ATPase subunit K